MVVVLQVYMYQDTTLFGMRVGTSRAVRISQLMSRWACLDISALRVLSYRIGMGCIIGCSAGKVLHMFGSTVFRHTLVSWSLKMDSMFIIALSSCMLDTDIHFMRQQGRVMLLGLFGYNYMIQVLVGGKLWVIIIVNSATGVDVLRLAMIETFVRVPLQLKPLLRLHLPHPLRRLLHWPLRRQPKLLLQLPLLLRAALALQR
jgi:hypothetical protein